MNQGCNFEYRVELAFEDDTNGPPPAGFHFLETDADTPNAISTGIEPWAECPDGDAMVLRVTGPLQGADGQATITMADCISDKFKAPGGN